MIWFVFRILLLCNDSTSQKTSAVWKYYGMDVQNHTVHCRWLRKAECVLMGSLPCHSFKVLLLHNSTTRGRFCPKNWWSSSALMFFSRLLFCSWSQNSWRMSVLQSTFCSCCWLQHLVYSGSTCSVQLWPDSGLDSEQLRLHHCRQQHQSGAENLLTSHWKKIGQKPASKTIHGAPLCLRCSGYYICWNIHYTCDSRLNDHNY